MNSSTAQSKSKFTFHYVSIKSFPKQADSETVLAFTFHYVSIKSLTDGLWTGMDANLHSTMYLLNLYDWLL